MSMQTAQIVREMRTARGETLEAVARAVDLAFVGGGFGPPAHLRAVPGPAADLVG